MSDNVFKKGYVPWRYLTNWPTNIHCFFRNFKWAWQRATRGYADTDVWDMYGWLLNVLSDAINYLAEHHMGWPGNEQFPEDMNWTEYLKQIAQLFYQANEMNEFYPTTERDRWWQWYQDKSVEEQAKCGSNPYSERMFKEDNENAVKRDADFHAAWKMMEDVFWHLWD